ncbi:hypothetical protein [Mongoliibacter ruber]|uniref:RHS repeat-associated protein n=1 Tax=Mongoliibacter ruber TaxID=1750599 RepID=A0A2T0WLQ8_9BACT|nr:hypothetical protein [Mongoliibacter ruber]PRY87641.1 hypothetical protein CLW00_106268 [Mongoliibacter ruber]
MAELAPGWTPYRYGFNNPVKFIDPDGMFEYSDGYSTQDSKNSTGAISFSGSYIDRTINTDYIEFSTGTGDNRQVLGGYTETYVAESGTVLNRKYFGSPYLFGAGGFGDMGGDGCNCPETLSAGMSGRELSRNAWTGMLLASEGYLFNQEAKTAKKLKNTPVEKGRHALKQSSKMIRGLGGAVATVGVVLSVNEAIEKGTTGAWSMAGADATMAVVGIFCPVCGVAYGVTRFGLEMAGVDVAGNIDNWLK